MPRTEIDAREERPELAAQHNGGKALRQGRCVRLRSCRLDAFTGRWAEAENPGADLFRLRTVGQHFDSETQFARHSGMVDTCFEPHAGQMKLRRFSISGRGVAGSSDRVLKSIGVDC